jgi:hypothetical protein
LSVRVPRPPVPLSEELMKITSILSCALICLVIVAHGQQPEDWRPNIAEDNKAASWEDTSAFMISVLNQKGLVPLHATSPRRCVIEEVTLHGPRTNAYQYEMGKIDPLSIYVIGQKDGTFSLVYFSGTAYRPYGLKIVVDRDPKEPSTTSAGRCSTNENSCKETTSVLVDPDETEFTDQESARRFARALVHAALLCGGAKAVSPF